MDLRWISKGSPRELVSAGKRVASNKETRGKVKKEFGRGKDIVQDMLGDTAEEVPYASNIQRVAAAEKIGKNLPRLVKAARKSESTSEFDKTHSEVMTDAVFAAVPDTVMPAGFLKDMFSNKPPTASEYEAHAIGIQQLAQALKGPRIKAQEANAATSGRLRFDHNIWKESRHFETIYIDHKDTLVTQQPSSLQVPTPNLLKGPGPMN